MHTIVYLGPQSKYTTVPSPLKRFLKALLANPSTYPGPWQPGICFLCLQVCLLQNVIVSGIIWYITFFKKPSFFETQFTHRAVYSLKVHRSMVFSAFASSWSILEHFHHLFPNSHTCQSSLPISFQPSQPWGTTNLLLVSNVAFWICLLSLDIMYLRPIRVVGYNSTAVFFHCWLVPSYGCVTLWFYICQLKGICFLFGS